MSQSLLARNGSILASWPTFFRGQASDTTSLTALYHPEEGTLVDHAFNVVRTGQRTLAGHWVLWLEAIPDFRAEVISVIPTEQGGWLTYRGIGTFKNSLAGVYPPTGKSFVFEAVLRAWIDESGLITRSEEWYSKEFGNSVRQEEYGCISDTSSSGS